MKRIIFGFLPLVLITLASLGGKYIPAEPQAVHAAVDLRVLFQLQNDAQNRGDVAAVMATYSDDAVVRAGGLCAANPCVGKTAIQREVERRIAQRAQVKVLSLQESNGTASGVLEVTEDQFASCGVQRVLVNFTFVVSGDRMSSWTSGPDGSDEQSARFVACITARMAAGVSPPNTGDGGLRAADLQAEVLR